MTRLVLTVLPAPDSPEIINKTFFYKSTLEFLSWVIQALNFGPRLTSNQHRLIVTFSQHVIVSVIRNGEDVWRHFRLSLALVTSDNMIVIYWEPLVGIDSDTEETLIL